MYFIAYKHEDNPVWHILYANPDEDIVTTVAFAQRQNFSHEWILKICDEAEWFNLKFYQIIDKIRILRPNK